MEQVPMESGVVNFEIVSIDVLLPAMSRFRRSEMSDYLVTFEVSLEVDQDVETSDQLCEIFSKIENFKPGSLEVTDQQLVNKDGEFS